LRGQPRGTTYPHRERTSFDRFEERNNQAPKRRKIMQCLTSLASLDDKASRMKPTNMLARRPDVDATGGRDFGQRERLRGLVQQIEDLNPSMTGEPADDPFQGTKGK
jgi:hypothetical protein